MISAWNMRWMRLAMVALVFTTDLTAAEQGQSHVMAYHSALEACLSKAKRDQLSLPMACIGTVMRLCLQKGADASAPDHQRQCAKQEREAWALRFAKAYKVAQQRAPHGAALPKPLKDSLALRDRFCEAFDTVDPGMAPGGSEVCLLQEQAVHTLLMEALAEAFSPH